MALEISQYGPTQLRNALAVLLDLVEGGGLVLTPWQLDFSRLKVTQAHYGNRERLAIIRIILSCVKDEALTKALAARKNANSQANRTRAGKYCNEHAGHGCNKTGSFSCVICNTGAKIHYHIGRGTLAAVCENRQCVRLISGPDDYTIRKPRFANILPYDVGTYLVESETTFGVFYVIDVVEQNCTCDDFKFRGIESHKCKHLLETNYAVFEMGAF